MPEVTVQGAMNDASWEGEKKKKVSSEISEENALRLKLVCSL
jgi:hypothetical protein